MTSFVVETKQLSITLEIVDSEFSFRFHCMSIFMLLVGVRKNHKLFEILLQQPTKVVEFFLQEKNGVLVELSDREAQVKVGHAIRDMVIAKAKTQSNELSKIKSKSMNVKFSKIRRMSSLLAVQYQNITSHSNFAPDDECSLYDYEPFEPIPLNSIVSESNDKYIDIMMDSFVMDDNFVKDISEDFHVSGLEELLELNLDETFSPRMGELLMKHLIE